MKILEKLKKHLERKPKGYYKTYRVGGFIVDLFYDETDTGLCYADIYTDMQNFEVVLGINHDGYGLLMSAAKEDDEESIHAYCSLLSISASLLAIDTNFVGVVGSGFDAWRDRKMEEAKEIADKITPAEEDAEQKFMEDVVTFSELPKKEQKKRVRKTIEKLENDIKVKDGKKKK